MSMELKTWYLELETHLMEDAKPSAYLSQVLKKPEFREYPFALLYRLKEIKQSPNYHPVGNVWNHTMLVVDEAAKRRHESRHPKALMWAALLHDIGKAETTKVRRGRITAYDHDRAGAKLAREFFRHFSVEKQFADAVCALIRYHMQILFVVKNLPFADKKGMKRETDVREIALLGLCDRMGRGRSNLEEEERNIKAFLQKCGAD